MKAVKIASYKPLPILVLGVLIFFLFGPIIGFDFIAIDDGGQILENEKIHHLTLDNLLEIFSSDTVSMYQPLTSLFFALIIGLFGFKTAAAFHVASILIHVLNTCLVYALSQRLFQKKSIPFSSPPSSLSTPYRWKQWPGFPPLAPCCLPRSFYLESFSMINT